MGIDHLSSDDFMDTIRRLHGYVDARAPVFFLASDQTNRFCVYDKAKHTVTYGHDKLSLQLAYDIAVGFLRPLVLKMCSAAVGENEEFSVELYGLTGFGHIQNVADNVVVQFDSNEWRNSNEGANNDKAADELYALLNLCRVYKNKLSYSNKLGLKAAIPGFFEAHTPVSTTYSGPELMP